MDTQKAEITERRADVRQRVLKGVRIKFNKGYSAAEGVARNAGAGGMKIVFGDTLALPSEFELQLSDDDTWRKARVCWRTSAELGVALDEAAA